MHFDSDHLIRVPLERFYQVSLSREFNDWLRDKMKQAVRSIVRDEEIGGLLYRNVKAEVELAERAQKFLKVPRLIIEEQMVLDRAKNTFTWEYVPNVGIKRFFTSGTGRLEAVPEGTRRFISGDIIVKIALIGGRIEKHMVEWTTRNLSRFGDLLEEYCRNHPPGQAGGGGTGT